jgi:hypothetical protein
LLGVLSFYLFAVGFLVLSFLLWVWLRLVPPVFGHLPAEHAWSTESGREPHLVWHLSRPGVSSQIRLGALVEVLFASHGLCGGVVERHVECGVCVV